MCLTKTFSTARVEYNAGLWASAVMRWWMKQTLFWILFLISNETKARACDELHTWSNIQNHCGSMCLKLRDESNVAVTITRILTARAQRCSRSPLRRSSSLWNTGPLPIIPPSVGVSLFLTNRTDDKGDVGSPFCARAWGQMLRAQVRFGVAVLHSRPVWSSLCLQLTYISRTRAVRRLQNLSCNAHASLCTDQRDHEKSHLPQTAISGLWNNWAEETFIIITEIPGLYISLIFLQVLLINTYHVK